MRGKNQKSPWQNHDEEPDGELWLVSYADMVTLLFGFFVILYSFSNQDEGKFNKFSEKMAEAFKNPESASAKPETRIGDEISEEGRQARALQMLVAMLNVGESANDAVAKIEQAYTESKGDGDAKATEKQLLSRLGQEKTELLAKVTRESTASEDTVVVILPGETLFAPGSVVPLPGAAAKIRQLASELHLVHNIREIEVQGHTDSSKAVRDLTHDNFTVSSERAGAIARLLISGGTPASLLSVRGMGDLKPLLPERDAAGHWLPANMAKNRRVQLVIHKEPVHAP